MPDLPQFCNNCNTEDLLQHAFYIPHRIALCEAFSIRSMFFNMITYCATVAADNTSQCHGDTDKGILVCGQCVTTEKAKVTDPHNVLNRKAAITHSLKKTSSQRPKIRNYNVKADTGHI